MTAAKPQPEALTKMTPIAIDASGKLVPKDSAELRRVAQNYISSGATPTHLRTPERFELAFRMFVGLDVDPILSMKDCWYNDKTNTLSVCNNVPLAACQRSPDWVDIEEYFVNDKNERRTADNFVGFKIVGAVCVVKRKGRSDKFAAWTYEDADRAQLRNKDNWRKYGPTMLAVRARAIALKSQFADKLQGTAILEYDDQGSRALDLHGEIVDAPEPLKSVSSADEMNDMFGGDE